MEIRGRKGGREKMKIRGIRRGIGGEGCEDEEEEASMDACAMLTIWEWDRKMF